MKKRILFGSAVAAGAALYLAGRQQGLERGRFRPLQREETGGFLDALRWLATRKPGPWEKDEALQPGPPPPRHVEGSALRATFVGHATVLLQTEGMNLLTDPIWSERASPLPFVGPARVRQPGIRFADLPKIDAVLISHDHYDHFDRETIRKLAVVHRARFFVGLGNGARLARQGIEAREMHWWEEAPLGDRLRIACVPAQHFSGRGILDRDSTLWCGFVIRALAGPIYFAGDTGFGDHFAQIHERYGPTRLALLPIGAYEPRWFMKPVHISPEEAVRAHELLGAHASLAIHHSTFPMADEGRDEAAAALQQEAQAHRARFHTCLPGGVLELRGG
ncbi:MBL fold metallo-hydrolase [Vulgatibacter sp.]|uniref:MBL fold metallo-hydrolase n=1 Tax=Vulgatibacter sp. TaxID=1971226 RepID=UPI0035665974